MLKSKTLLTSSNFARYFATAPATKSSTNHPAVVSETSGDGVKLTCVTSPTLNSGLSRVVAIFKSGSRNEIKSSDMGLAHLVRRSFGLSTDQYTSINLTHHLEQMGARVKVHGTREHTIYTVDVAPNLASRAGYILTHMATAPAYYHWELKELTYKLMQHDIDLLNRRDMSNLCVDLLHEAAFGTHPDGTCLGRSLYASQDRLGTHSYEQITNFLKSSVVPGKCAITLMNLGSGHKHMDPHKSLDEIKSGLEFHPPNKNEVVPKHDFVGNEVRRENSISPSTHVMVAYHVPGGRKDAATNLAMAIASQAIQGGVHQIRYADAGSRSSRLAKTAEGTGFEDYLTQCGSFNYTYSDNGLLGFAVTGSCGRATGARVVNAVKAMADLAKSGLTPEEVNNGKSILKTNLALKTENLQDHAVDITMQVLESGSFKSYEQQAADIDALSADSINQALKKVLGSGKMAMSAVGANTAYTPALSLLKH